MSGLTTDYENHFSCLNIIDENYENYFSVLIFSEHQQWRIILYKALHVFIYSTKEYMYNGRALKITECSAKRAYPDGKSLDLICAKHSFPGSWVALLIFYLSVRASASNTCKWWVSNVIITRNILQISPNRHCKASLWEWDMACLLLV